MYCEQVFVCLKMNTIDPKTIGVARRSLKKEVCTKCTNLASIHGRYVITKMLLTAGCHGLRRVKNERF